MSAMTSITQKCHDIDNLNGRLCQHIDNPCKCFCSIMSPPTHLLEEAVKWNKNSEDLVYSYVKAVIVTQIHSLQIYLGDDLVDTIEYRLTG